MLVKNLEQAVLTNNRELAKLFVDEGADPHVQTSTRQSTTLLTYAIWQGKREAALGILSSTQFKFTNNPSSACFGLTVAQALVSGWTEIIPELLQKPRDPAVRLDVIFPPSQETCLGYAVRVNCPPAILQLLVDHGGNPNRVAANNLSPLHWAIANRKNEAALAMINSKAFVFTPETEPALTQAIASANGDNGIVLALMASKKKNKHEVTLRSAIEANDLKQVETLIAAGANVNEVNVGETYPTPLFLAVSKGSAEMVQLLVNHKADSNSRRVYEKVYGEPLYQTPLSLAVFLRKPELIMIMIESEHFQFTTDSGLAVLEAVHRDQPELLGMLLEKHKDAAASVSLDQFCYPILTNWGVALCIAIEKGYEEAVTLLLAHGANPHQHIKYASATAFQRAITKHQSGSKILSLIMGSKNFNGDIEPLLRRLEAGSVHFAPPLIEYAKEPLLNIVANNGYLTALRILLEHGLNPNEFIEHMPGWTPLTMAIFKHQIQAAIMMVKSPQFVYTKYRGGTALSIAKSSLYAEECKELITLLEAKKRDYEDDLLWERVADDNHDVIVVPTPVVPATTAPLTMTAPSEVRPVDPKFSANTIDDPNYTRKGGLFEL